MTRLALYWEEAQIIGALATAITFILILITFVLPDRSGEKPEEESYVGERIDSQADGAAEGKG